VLLLNSSILLTSMLAGVVALLAPCCASVMLPAYFASGLRRRRRIASMTLLFAAGVGTVILPIALGASALSGAVQMHHTLVFSIGGLVMLAMGLVTLAGHAPTMKMPFTAPLGRDSATSVWALGAFSGVASACCAPVLAGVAGLAGASSSFPLALAIGAAYVFGMVAPLAALALVWDRRDWGALLSPGRRRVTLPLGRRRLSLPLVNLLSGTLLVAMGVLTLVTAFRGPAMSNTGWQVHLTATLNHWATTTGHALSFLPGWLATSLVVALATGLVLSARRTHASPPRDARPESTSRTSTPSTLEATTVTATTTTTSPNSQELSTR
jgi:cytochrome c-type biogenesis protein